MYSFHVCKIWIIYCSFIIAILLQSIFMFLIKWYFNPSWVMMLLIYWIVVFPKQVNIGTGFILGLIMDYMFGAILGTQSLSFSIISYITVRRVYFFRHASVLQQSFFVLFSSLIDQSIKLLIKFLITQILSFSPEIIWKSLLDGIVWIFLIVLVRRIYRF